MRRRRCVFSGQECLKIYWQGDWILIYYSKWVNFEERQGNEWVRGCKHKRFKNASALPVFLFFFPVSILHSKLGRKDFPFSIKAFLLLGWKSWPIYLELLFPNWLVSKNSSLNTIFVSQHRFSNRCFFMTCPARARRSEKRRAKQPCWKTETWLHQATSPLRRSKNCCN